MLLKRKVAASALTLLVGLTIQTSPASARTVRRKAIAPPRRVAAGRPVWESVKNKIAACESGGRYDARNRRSTASGKYQFLNTTWAGRYGVKRAYLATPEQQEQAAMELYVASGLQPWRASQRCWSRA